MNSVVDLFRGGAQSAGNSPLAQNIQSGYAQDLVHKFGLDHGKAGRIAASLIPIVLQKLIHKTNDPNDNSFNLQSIVSHLTGGAGLQDITGNFGAGNDNESGAVMGKIKGMFN